MTKKQLELSVFFPCHNEEGNIQNVLKDALEILDNSVDDFEILVIDDGSTDRTPEIVRDFQSRDSRIKLIRYTKWRGYGHALRNGFASATKNLVFYSDGDFQFRLKDLSKLLKILPESDIVSAYRIKRNDPFFRTLLAGLYEVTCSLLFDINIRDINCAFKLYRREVLDSLQLCSGGAVIDAEVLIKAKKKGFRITQVGVPHYPRLNGHQKGVNFQVILKALKELASLYYSIHFNGASTRSSCQKSSLQAM